MSEKCCEMPVHTSIHTPIQSAKKCSVFMHMCVCVCVYTHSLAQQELIWWIKKGPSRREFVMFCLFMSIKSFVYAGVMYHGPCMWWSICFASFFFFYFASCFCLLFCFPICRKLIHPWIKCPVWRIVTLTIMTVTPRSFLCVWPVC